jgi:hypothetical protein
MGRSYHWKRHQPLLGHIPEECAIEEGLYDATKKTTMGRCNRETFMSLWRDILFIWIIFPILLFAQFHVSSLGQESGDQEEDMSLPLSWRKLAPAILLFSVTAWFYRRNVCIIDNEYNENDYNAIEPLPLGLVLLPEIFVGTVLLLASVLQNATRALDVLLFSIVILSALAACLSRRPPPPPPHEHDTMKFGYEAANLDKATTFTWDTFLV